MAREGGAGHAYRIETVDKTTNPVHVYVVPAQARLPAEAGRPALALRRVAAPAAGVQEGGPSPLTAGRSHSSRGTAWR